MALVFYIGTSGDINIYLDVTHFYGRRPAFVLPGTLSVDDSGNVVTNQPPTAPGSIQVSSVVSGGTTTITVTSASDPDGSVVSYHYERSVDGGAFTQIANTSSLSYQDTIDRDWATVQYRVCAEDDMGATGGYVTSDNYTIIDGYIIISGPSLNMGTHDTPFTFNATINVSGLTNITDINVSAYVDGDSVLSDTVNQGQQIQFEIDTRAMGSGEHKVRIVADHDVVLPAMQDYTFTVTGYTLPDGGRDEIFEDEYGTAIFPVMLAKYVIGATGESIQNEIDDMEQSHRGINGYLEHVDTVSGTASYTLTRESGVTYAVELNSPIASGTSQPMHTFCIPSGYNGSATLGSIGSVNAQSDTIAFTMDSTAVLKIMRYKTID